MTPDTPGTTQFPPTTVLAIWNRDLTLKICLGDSITQEETQCECVHLLEDDDDEPIRCEESAWPRYNGPIVVCGDGHAHYCEDCVGEHDPDFVLAYEEAFGEALDFSADGGESLWLEN